MKKILPMVMVVIVGLILGVSVFVMVDNREKENMRLEFESRAELIADSMQGRINEYVSTLQFLGDFIYNSSRLGRVKFSNFVKGPVYRYPAIKALSWDILVEDADRAAFEQGMRQEGFSDFQIREKNAQGEMIPAGKRKDYVVVTYIDPYEENKAAQGYDVASEDLRRKGLLAAMHSGMPWATQRLKLIQDDDNSYGLLVLLPIFKQEIPLDMQADDFGNLRGFAVEVLKIGDVVDSVFSVFSGQGIDVSLFDLSAPPGEQFLCLKLSEESRAVLNKVDSNRILQSPEYSRALEFAGRAWEMRFTRSPSYIMTHTGHHAYVILAGILLLTLMMASYLHIRSIYTTEIENAIKAEMVSNKKLENEIYMRKQEAIQLANAKHSLENEILERVEVEKQRDQSIRDLKQALAEVKTLRGILPLCSFCKKIRDDEGYWEQVDVYIHKHSQADISHSICPDCLKKHYPVEYEELYGANEPPNHG